MNDAHKDDVTSKEYKSFASFYPFYLSQHQHPMNRLLHVVGTSLGLLIMANAILTGTYALILAGLVCLGTRRYTLWGRKTIRKVNVARCVFDIF